MARPKTEFRNEMKTRVPDRVYEGVQRFRAEMKIDSESRAISQLLELALFGTIGNVPEPLIEISHQMGQFGTEIRQ